MVFHLQIRQFHAALQSRDQLLYRIGWVFFCLSLIFIGLVPFDDRLILGINPWIKPAKFSISIAIFLWTMGWLLGYLKLSPQRQDFFSRFFCIVMTVEILAISLQSFRGVTSHFNQKTLFDGVIFNIMGVMITLSTILVSIIMINFFKIAMVMDELRQRRPYLWGIRLGLLIFILGSIEGAFMAAYMQHTVGLEDGGAGLPILNWSTLGGDLRVAHFFGLHAIQIVPFLGYLISLRTSHPALIFAIAFLYFAIFCGLFVQALMGIPLIDAQYFTWM